MAPVDLSKNRNEILKVHKEVSDLKSSTNWALFGYEGKTSTLVVISKGDGGIEEFVNELNSGRIMYGYLKVIDPNSNLPKFVFVNWQGEGVPEIVKGSSASHVRDVSNLLRGYHVSINARNEDDLDEETITSKVSKSSGANYSFHKEQRKDVQPSGPVGSVYEKIKPQIEIKPILRDKFWEDAAKEEQNRKASEKTRMAAEREKFDKEIKERELQDAKKREENENNRLKKAREIKAANQKADAPQQRDKSAWEQEQEQARRDEEERAKRGDQVRKERANEAQKLIASATSQARSVFMQKPASQFDDKDKVAPPARKLRNDFQGTEDKVEPNVIKSPPRPPQVVSPAVSMEEKVEEDHRSVEEVVDESEEPCDNIYDDGAAVSQGFMVNDEDIYDDAQGVRQDISSMVAHHLPKRIESDDEEPEDHVAQEDDIYDDAGVCMEGSGPCAIATYDYQAAEDNEISFDPGDKITNIDMIDDGWWVGTDKDGKRGMFPSNYVELIDS